MLLVQSNLHSICVKAACLQQFGRAKWTIPTAGGFFLVENFYIHGILAWCFFSHYWKELKCLISCICLQCLTLYRTSVIWLVFITIHVEAMMNCCFNVFIRLHRYVLWASTHLSSKDYLDGLIDQIQHNGMCQSTSQPFLNISLFLMWL